MSTFIKSLFFSCLVFFIVACSSLQEDEKVKVPEKITLLFVTQPSCPSCDKLEETMKLVRPKELLNRYFDFKRVYLGEKLPDGLMKPNGTPTVYFLGANNEVLVEPMIGEKTEDALMEFLEDALFEFKNIYKVDLIEKMKSQKNKENNETLN